MNPLLARVLRILLMSVGGTLVVSAVVNIIAAVQLIEPSDEEMIGITRGEVIRSFAASLLVGAALIYLGLRRWSRRPPR